VDNVKSREYLGTYNQNVSSRYGYKKNGVLFLAGRIISEPAGIVRLSVRRENAGAKRKSFEKRNGTSALADNSAARAATGDFGRREFEVLHYETSGATGVPAIVGVKTDSPERMRMGIWGSTRRLKEMWTSKQNVEIRGSSQERA
jgi:hypothetical protein